MARTSSAADVDLRWHDNGGTVSATIHGCTRAWRSWPAESSRSRSFSISRGEKSKGKRLALLSTSHGVVANRFIFDVSVPRFRIRDVWRLSTLAWAAISRGWAAMSRPSGRICCGLRIRRTTISAISSIRRHGGMAISLGRSRTTGPQSSGKSQSAAW